jgi:hypothetical protein
MIARSGGILTTNLNRIVRLAENSLISELTRDLNQIFAR